jgi:hypothetical protein
LTIAGCHESRSSGALVIKDAAGDGPLATDATGALDVSLDSSPPRVGCERSYPVCNANTATYACGLSDYPPDTECVSNDQEPSGEVTRCCKLKASISTCIADPEVTCAGDDIGYSCSGWDTPAQSDDLICDERGPGQSGRSGFCCRLFRSTSCTLTPPGGGCVGGMYVFTCDIHSSPDQDDKRLDCHPRDNMLGYERVYCCNAHKPLSL